MWTTSEDRLLRYTLGNHCHHDGKLGTGRGPEKECGGGCRKGSVGKAPGGEEYSNKIKSSWSLLPYMRRCYMQQQHGKIYRRHNLTPFRPPTHPQSDALSEGRGAPNMIKDRWRDGKL